MEISNFEWERLKKIENLNEVIKDKGRRICAAGILRCNVISIDDCVVEWIDGEDFSLATLAKTIGIDVEHNAKVKVIIELAEEPCVICGKLTVGNNLCDKCHSLICGECAKKDELGRHCPTCVN